MNKEVSVTQKPIYPQTEEYLAHHIDKALLQNAATDHSSKDESNHQSDQNANHLAPLAGLHKLFLRGVERMRFTGTTLNRPPLKDSGHTMTIKYTLADASVLAKDATLDTIWSNAQTARDTIVGQYESIAHLFDASNDYYVAFIDATKLTRSGVVKDATFATDDTSGTLIHGVVFDKSAGIAYIPKSLFTNKKGQEIAFGIQAQLLVGIELNSDLQTRFQARVTSKRVGIEPLKETQIITVDSLENTVTIPLVSKHQAEKISLADLVVYTDSNSSPYKLSTQEGAFYDKNTGKLTLALSPFAQPSITVQITSKSAINTLVDTFMPATPAYGFARISHPDEMAMWPWGKFDSIDLSKIQVGDKYEFQTSISYDDAYFRAFATQCAPYIYAWTNNTVGYKGEESTEVLIDKLLSGATWDDMDSHLAKLSDADGHAIKLVDDVAFALGLPWGHSKYSAWDFNGLRANDPHTDQARGSGVIPMLCGHVKQPKNVVKPGTYSECTAMLRVLAKKETGDTPYVVLGFVSPQVTTQSGVAVVKFGVLQPKIKTELTEDTTHSHTIAQLDMQETSESISLTDHVSYSGLVKDAQYTLKASLVDKTTGHELNNSLGVVTCTEKFTPKESSGGLDLHFSIDKLDELPNQLVSYVSLFDSSGKEVVKHHDLNNQQQTLWHPIITTHLECDTTQEQILGLETTQKLTDKTSITGLVPNTKYVLKSELVDIFEETPAILAEQSYEFTAQDTNLEHVVAFEIDRQSVKGNRLVAQTRLYEGDRCVVEHTSLNNSQQTVLAPTIKTELANKQTSDKTVAAFPLELIDTVSYAGLIPGKQYKMVGTLMDKQTQEPLTLDSQNPLVTEVEFTPEAPDGVVEVPFTIHQQPNTDLHIVAFEKLYLGEVELANHEDFDDEGQSFLIPKPPTPPQPETPPKKFWGKKIKLPKTGDLLSVGFIVSLAVGGWLTLGGSRAFKHHKNL
ncbi:VaFE repeat-containing surface-anchored protein [Atopobium fossor]|uniref:VaFE repeat-containing surface-anchored protein n=1 Tax=Atopobium fossor TaxID=39487 RepID=UPI000403FB24|nr:VaFE repeat-containing surface-anchored protein [Atopobium fossor]